MVSETISVFDKLYVRTYRENKHYTPSGFSQHSEKVARKELFKPLSLIQRRCYDEDILICTLCGFGVHHHLGLKHLRDEHPEWISALWRLEKLGSCDENLVQIKVTLRHPLKPWKDPESLFCDTEFLEGLLGKRIARG